MINEINNGVARICANCDYRNIRSTEQLWFIGIWLYGTYLLGQKILQWVTNCASCGCVEHQKVNPNDFLEAEFRFVRAKPVFSWLTLIYYRNLYTVLYRVIIKLFLFNIG